jgi:putative DNA primase/helicase
MRRSAHELLDAAEVRLSKYSEGEHRTACPKCAITKRRLTDGALAVKIDSDRVIWLCHRCGWRSGSRLGVRLRPPKLDNSKAAADARNRAYAAKIWREARPAAGTIVESYLRRRGITCAVPKSIRFHPRCRRGENEYLPAMVAEIVDIRTNQFRALHRTYLKADGSAKIERGAAKMMLASPFDACIKLTPDADVTLGLGVSEGIETGLSLISIGWRAVWAAGDAGAIRRFPILPGVDAITLFADNDVNEIGVEAARKCAARWRAAGRESNIFFPNTTGHDWNDVINGNAS